MFKCRGAIHCAHLGCRFMSTGAIHCAPTSRHTSCKKRSRIGEKDFYSQGAPGMYDLPQGTVTFLFTGIEGSTHLQQQLGERYAGVLAELRQLLRAALRVWNGREVDTQGDAFFMAFARATDAVSAAVDIQRTLAAHAWPEHRPMV